MLRALLSSYIAHAPRHRGKMSVIKAALALTGNIPVESYYGVRMFSDRKDRTNILSLTGKYDDVFAVVSELQPGMMFLDIGANAGLFSLIAAKRIGPQGRVIAFEPSLSVFRKLVDNIHLNGFKNIFPMMIAIGDRTELVSFEPGESAHSGIGHLSATGSSIVSQLDGKVLSPIIDSIIGESPTMIKIDVEGAEGIVVRTLAPFFRRPHIKTAVIEIDAEYLKRFNGGKEAIYRVMDECGLVADRTHYDSAHYNEVFRRL